MMGTLLGVEVENCALVVRKLRNVAQYLLVGKCRRENGTDVECLFALGFSGRGGEVAECADCRAVAKENLRALATSSVTFS